MAGTRTCILHIGVHKTGTTAVQKSLAVHRDGLRAAGILVPGLPGQAQAIRGHHGLAIDLGASADDPGRPAFRAAHLMAALDETEADTVVVSSETMSAVQTRPEAIRDLIEAIVRRDFTPVVVATVRLQESILNSSYLQSVKMFKVSGAFADFAGAIERDAFYDFNTRLERWYDLPGLRFAALTYTRSVIRSGIAHAVLEAGGIGRERLAAAGFVEAGVENPSPGREGVAAHRFLARTRPELRGHPNASRLFQVVYRANDAYGWNRERFVGPGAEAVARIREAFAASNQAFAARFMGASWESCFADELAQPWRSNELDVDAFAAAHPAELDVVARKLQRVLTGERPERPLRPARAAPIGGPLGWLRRLWR